VVHLQLPHSPVRGSRRFGDRKYHLAESSESLIDRVALHAARLEFIHPRSGNCVAFDCDLPPGLRQLIQGLSH